MHFPALTFVADQILTVQVSMASLLCCTAGSPLVCPLHLGVCADIQQLLGGALPQTRSARQEAILHAVEL